MFPLAKVSAIMLATATRDRDTRQSLLTCLGHLGRRNINRNDPICVVPPKVAKASTVKSHRVLLLPAVLLTNVANVNDPLLRKIRTLVYTIHSFLIDCPIYFSGRGNESPLPPSPRPWNPQCYGAGPFCPRHKFQHKESLARIIMLCWLLTPKNS